MKETVDEIFNYWVFRHFGGKGRSPVLTTERERIIVKALKSFDVVTVKAAIDGCLKSGWHMGENPSNKKYNDISLILRNAEKIEGFAALAENDDAPVPSTEDDNWIAGLVGRAFALWNIEPSVQRRAAAVDAWFSVLHDLDPDDCVRALTSFSVAGNEFMPRPGELRRMVLADRLTAPAPLEAWMLFQSALRDAQAGVRVVPLHECVAETLRRVGGGSGLHTNGDREMFVGVYKDVVNEFEQKVLSVES